MCGCSRKRGRGTLSNELDDDAKTRAAQGRRRQNGEGWDTGQDRPGGDLWATSQLGRTQNECASIVPVYSQVMRDELDDEAKTRAAHGGRRNRQQDWYTGHDEPYGDVWATALVGRKQTECAAAVAREAEAHYRMSSTTTPKHVPLRADGGKMGKAGTQDRTDQVETSGQHPNSGARKMNVLP